MKRLFKATAKGLALKQQISKARKKLELDRIKVIDSFKKDFKAKFPQCDFETNDLEAARKFELLHNTEIEEEEIEDCEEEYEECGCSDWGCPCGGNKKGSL